MVERLPLDHPLTDQRRQDPVYLAIQRADMFLHKLMEDPQYKDEAAEIHGEIHEAAYLFVTTP